MSVFLHTFLQYGDLTEMQIRAFSGALINQLFLDQPIPEDMFADLTYEHEIPFGVSPGQTIVKMAKGEHVEAFFNDGTLKLGSFSYYNAFDHDEIGDATEGSFVLVGRRPGTTSFVKIGGGHNCYVFCCFARQIDHSSLNIFGYDSGFRILDAAAFSRAVQARLGAVDARYSECVYRKDKVVVGQVAEDFDFNVISSRLLEMADEAKFFVKPDRYAHQSEFRFIWSMSNDVDGPVILKCPEAVEYCEQIGGTKQSNFAGTRNRV